MTNKYYDGSDMRIDIPVSTQSTTTGKTTGYVPITDFTLVEFDVYIGNEKIKECTYPDEVSGKLLAVEGSGSHIFVLPLTAEDHQGKYGLIDIEIRATIENTSYGEDGQIVPARVKGGEKIKRLDE